METNKKSHNSLRLAFALIGGGLATSMATNVAHAETVTVKQGQSLKSIAKEHHVTVKALAKENKLDTDAKLKESQQLEIPKAPKQYTVHEGDSVSSIAQNHGLKTEDVLKWNHLSWDDSTIYIGDKLNLEDPNEPGSDDSDNTAQVQTNNSSARDASIIGNTQAEQIVNLAKQYASMNIPYVWGGSTPQGGFDCSGLTSYVYGQVGINIGRNTIAQEAHVQTTDISDASQVASVARPGDLLFWGGHGSTYHVAIYIGNNQFVAAPQPGQNVDIETVSNYFKPSFVGSVVR